MTTLLTTTTTFARIFAKTIFILGNRHEGQTQGRYFNKFNQGRKPSSSRSNSSNARMGQYKRKGVSRSRSRSDSRKKTKNTSGSSQQQQQQAQIPLIKQNISQPTPVLTPAPSTNVPIPQTNQLTTTPQATQLQSTQPIQPQDITAYPPHLSMPYIGYPYPPPG